MTKYFFYHKTKANTAAALHYFFSKTLFKSFDFLDLILYYV